MAEIIQQILTLPRPQQIAIIQAIMAQWQMEEGDQGHDEILAKQLATGNWTILKLYLRM